MHSAARTLLIVVSLVATTSLCAQSEFDETARSKIPNEQLDAARNLQPSQLQAALHKALPEQYIWTERDTGAAGAHYNPSPETKAGERAVPHFFRRVFHVDAVPASSTLYVAGPGAATLYLNGNEIGRFKLNLDSDIGIRGPRVYTLDVTSRLRAGENVLAIEARSGPTPFTEAEDVVSRHMRYGKLLAAMIVPAARGLRSVPLVMSDAQWRTTGQIPAAGWQGLGFNEAGWHGAEALGGIESSVDLFQGNSDAGMYAWPGYDGISAYLAHYSLEPVEVSHVYEGVGAIKNPGAVAGEPGDGELSVRLPSQSLATADAPPQMLLDFGREVVGRIEMETDSDDPAEATVQYGESVAEAVLQPYIGTNTVYLPPHHATYGPKSAFRYALIRFTGGLSTRFRAIRLDGIAYPVKYQGAFESSDPALNAIWWVGAHTAHLCMEDGVWDGPKRDRNRWMGDVDVTARTIEDVFGDAYLTEDTLERLLGPAPVAEHVNGIPGYSAFWVIGEKEFYLHTGSLAQLQRVHVRLVQLLEYMRKDLDDRNLFADRTGAWPFVDWAPDMQSDTSQARMATQFEYYAAFKDGAYLLGVLHDEKNAGRMQAQADALKQAAQRYMRNSQGTFGDRWHTNAYAVLSGAADPDQYAAIWRDVLSQVGQPRYDTTIVTPYYGFYVLGAMAEMGQRKAALDWIRKYWGGMVQEGATSFWEGYNTTWFKGPRFHESLQGDDVSGLVISLAHGWSSGATAWLMTEVLGIRPVSGGFKEVEIRPDLIDLKWARGAEPTPHGLLQVEIRDDEGYTTTVSLPPGIVARVSVPVASASAAVAVNGKRNASVPAEGGKRAVVTLSGQGSYVVTSR
jgi:hypothetical protein